MRLSLAFVVAAGFCAAAASSAVLNSPASSDEALVEVRHTTIAFDFGDKPVSKWSGEALVLADDTGYPTIYAWGRDGALLSRVPFAIQGSNRIRTRAFARGSDGTLVVAGTATTNEGGLSYLAFVRSDGQDQRIVRLNSFLPYEVALSADGTCWIAGEERRNGEESPDQKVIRRYSASGELLGEYIPRSTLKSHQFGSPAEDSFLAASHARIGWYSNITREYIELAPDGKVLARVLRTSLGANDRVTGLGMCDDDGPFLSVQYGTSAKELRAGIYRLDRTGGTWSAVADYSTTDPNRPPGLVPWVLGCDGNSLVTKRGSELRWFRPNAAH